MKLFPRCHFFISKKIKASRMEKIYIIVKRGSGSRNPCKQTLIEQENLNKRIKRNQPLYSEVQRFLDRFFGGNFHLKEAVALASNICTYSSAKLDRIAKRHKPAIICWFCENWQSIVPYLLKMKGIKLPDEENSTAVSPEPQSIEDVASTFFDASDKENFEFEYSADTDEFGVVY